MKKSELGEKGRLRILWLDRTDEILRKRNAKNKKLYMKRYMDDQLTQQKEVKQSIK